MVGILSDADGAYRDKVNVNRGAVNEFSVREASTPISLLSK